MSSSWMRAAKACPWPNPKDAWQTQAILDKMCANEIEQLRQTNENLRQQLAMANLAASQTAQTQQIIAALAPAA